LTPFHHRRGGAKVNVLRLGSTTDGCGHPPPLENQYNEVSVPSPERQKGSLSIWVFCSPFR
jgi:hypothetical protein